MELYLNDEQPLDFDEFASQLLEQGAEHSPAHLHGGICGILAGGGDRDAEYCLAAVSQALELGVHGELAENCLKLAVATLQALDDDGFDFQLFLPDDETEMEQRVRALSDWCSGFLSGYALVAAARTGVGVDQESAEILKDVAAMAEAAVDDEADPEDSEGDFFELTEYLRFAVINMCMNAAEDRASRENEP